MEFPTKQWWSLFKKKKHLLGPSVDLNEYFTAREIANQPVARFSLGELNLPTGEIVALDPLVYLDQEPAPYWQKAPAGRFPLTACVVVNEEEGPRYAAVAVEFSPEEPASYIEALTGHENLAELEKGEFFGFDVEAGLGSVIDAVTLERFVEFWETWQEDNPDGNIYDDYFAALFAESYRQHPEFQREGGDWINWTIPGTDLNVPMFQSGFGDGVYPVYFGFNKTGQVVRLVVHFIDIALEYEEEL